MPLFSRITYALLASLALCSIALAKPSPEILKKITSSYQPAVSWVVKSEESFGWSGVSECTKKEVEITGWDPVTGKPRRIYVNVYYPTRTDDPGNLPTILINPPTGGGNLLDTGFANTTCFIGFRIAAIQRWDFLDEMSTEIDLHNRAALRELAAIRQTIEYLDPRRNTQLGILGTSRGAISASVALAIDDRIASAVLIAGGGNLAQIIAESSEEGMKKLRETRMASSKYRNAEAYLKALKTGVLYEPLDFVDMAPTKPVWMMMGTQDRNVPSVCQKALADAYGSGRLHLETFDGDHLPTIFHAFLEKGPDMIAFFLRTLK